MPPLSNQLRKAMSEEIYVDKDGYAHDDEGNRWFVGKRYAGRMIGTYRARDVPPPADKPSTGKRRFRSKVLTPLAGQDKRIEAFEKLPAHAREGSFGKSILSQLRAQRVLSPKQKKAVRQMFYRAKLRDLADLFRD